MRLILVRHGESEANLRRITAGERSCTGLTEVGFEQAKTLAERFTKTGEAADCTTLLVSPLERAQQTARSLHVGLPGTEPETVDDLCELRPGDADGLTIEEVDQRYGLFDMIAFPDRVFAPNGESWSAFSGRVQGWLTQLEQDYRDETVVAVTHGGVIISAMITLLGIPRPGTGAQLHPSHTSLTEWIVESDSWQLVRYNDAGHISQTRQS